MHLATLDQQYLLNPLDVRSFLDRYWEQAPLVVPRGQQEYYGPLFRSQDLDSLLASQRFRAEEVVLVRDHDCTSAPAALAADGKAELALIREHMQTGASLVVTFIEEHWPPLAQLSRALEAFFRHHVSINAFLTPLAGQTLRPHLDEHNGFLLQIAGRKRWQVYEPATPFPLDGQIEVAAEQLGKPILDVELAPGDLLYIPRGFVHQGQASAGSSLHLTVCVWTLNWEDLLVEAIRGVSRRHEQLRHALPHGLQAGQGTPDAARQLRELLRLVGEQADLAEAIARLDEQFLTSLPVPPVGAISSLPDLAQLDTGTVVRKRAGMLCRVTRSPGKAAIRFPGARIEGPSHIGPALSFISIADEFPIAALPGLNDAGRLVLARRLLTDGLLEIVSPGAAASNGQPPTRSTSLCQDMLVTTKG